MPSAKEQIADHLANRRVRPLIGRSAGQPGAQRVRGVGLDADRQGDGVSRCSDGQMPGSGETRPNPVFCAMPTQPDHTSAAAGAARTSSGQDRTVRPGGHRGGPVRLRLVRRSAPDRTTRARIAVAPGRSMPAVTAAMPVTTLRRGERVGFAGQRGQGGGHLGKVART
jgi:hypothetical protein